MKNKIFVLLVLVGCCLGCKKPSSSPSVILLSTYTHVGSTGTDVINFSYDDKNHLTEYGSATGKPDYKYVYDGNDRIIEQDYLGSTSSTQYLYTYNSSGTISVSVVNKQNGVVVGSATTNVYTVNSKQQTTRIDYGSGDYSLFAYDNDGNLLTQSDYGKTSNALLFQFSYTFDQKSSIFSNVAGNFTTIVTTQHIHNVALETYTSFNGNVQNVTTYTSTFDYDANGYPIKETRVTKPVTGSVSTDTYLYEYISK